MDSEYLRRLGLATGFFGITVWTMWFSFTGDHSLLPLSIGDALFLAAALIQCVWGVALLWGDDRQAIAWDPVATAAEGLFFYYTVLFVFAYIFAANANMDYVQRFIESGGNIQFAMDTRTERLYAALRYGPYALLNGGVHWWARTRRARLEAGRVVEERSEWEGETAIGGRDGAPEPAPTASAPDRAADHPDSGESEREATGRSRADSGKPTRPAGWTLPARGVPDAGPMFVRRWGVPLTILGVALTVLSFPSMASLRGFGFLGWIALVPLFVMLRLGTIRQGIWYGVVYGVLSTLVGNYWLGTFNLISLQAVGVIYLFFYLFYLIPVTLLLRWAKRGVSLVLPLSWAVFELARSSGFLGYPWLLIGHSQYLNLPLIQLASVGGVWLVGLVVAAVNGAFSEAVVAFVRGRVPRVIGRQIAAAGVVLLAALALGTALFSTVPDPDKTVRMALIQQNSDPRKHDYSRTFSSLKDLTNTALEHDPDLVVWSETAFVPNIRRWSQEDPERYHLARLVQEFLAYQDSIDTWLLTGNDDYRRVLDKGGTEIERLNYNAAVLFSDESERMQTYHKVKLVPFTEYFPYEEQLPWVYKMLQQVDIHFWEPGDEFTVFEHPKVTFSTPICYEDAFPQVVRQYALAGADMIVNISNDYWSLTEVAPKQHFVAGMFRAVELRRPVVRATAAGLTGHIDPAGRILATVPQYSEEFIIADVDLPETPPRTLYVRFGDWVPVVAGIGLIVIAILQLIPGWRNKGDQR